MCDQRVFSVKYTFFVSEPECRYPYDTEALPIDTGVVPELLNLCTLILVTEDALLGIPFDFLRGDDKFYPRGMLRVGTPRQFKGAHMHKLL